MNFRKFKTIKDIESFLSEQKNPAFDNIYKNATDESDKEELIIERFNDDLEKFGRAFMQKLMQGIS